MGCIQDLGTRRIHSFLNFQFLLFPSSEMPGSQRRQRSGGPDRQTQMALASKSIQSILPHFGGTCIYQFSLGTHQDWGGEGYHAFDPPDHPNRSRGFFHWCLRMSSCWTFCSRPQHVLAVSMCQLSDCTELYLYDQQLQLATFAKENHLAIALPGAQTAWSGLVSSCWRGRWGLWDGLREDVGASVGCKSHPGRRLQRSRKRGAGSWRPFDVPIKCLWALRCGNKLGTSPQKIGD